MAKFFSGDYLLGEFQLFSATHIAVLLLLALFNVLVVWWQRRTDPSRRRVFRYALAAFMVGQEISLSLWRLSIGTWSVGTSLPLHLCGAAILLCAVMLFTKSYALYEVTYFWGFGGAIQALLTPDSTYGFPHYRFFQVFLSHGAIITATVYMTFVARYRPTWRSLWKTFIVTNAYLVLIALFNLAVGGNYLFICHKPETPSLIDALGPWPWYVISLELIGIAVFLILYAPYAVSDLRRASRTRRLEREQATP